MNSLYLLFTEIGRVGSHITFKQGSCREHVCMWSYYTTEGTSTENPNC